MSCVEYGGLFGSHFFQDNLQKFVPSTGGQIGSDMITVGGHFVSKQTGHVHYGAMQTGGGPPVPPPKPGRKHAGAGGAGGAGDTVKQRVS